MKKSMRIVLVLSMLWGSLPILAQPPFAFDRQEQKEYLEQLLGESIEDKAMVSRLADMFLDERGRERIRVLSEEYFGGKLKDAVNESLSSLVGQELQQGLDEDYTYIGLDEVHMRDFVVKGGLIGAGIGVVLVKVSGMALLSVGGVAIPVLAGGYLTLQSFRAYREEYPNKASFDRVDELSPRNHEDEKSVDLHYRSWTQSESSEGVEGTCRLFFDHTLVEDTLWKTDYKIQDCTHGDGGIIGEGSFTIDERDMLEMFAQRIIEGEGL